MEILAHKMRKEEIINEIEVLNTEVKLTQFADGIYDAVLQWHFNFTKINALVLLQKFRTLFLGFNDTWMNGKLKPFD